MASLLRRFVHSFLVIALLFPYISYGEGYIGEDLGTDLYRKIDAGQGGVSKALVGKRIVGSNARMNKAIQAECFK